MRRAILALGVAFAALAAVGIALAGAPNAAGRELSSAGLAGSGPPSGGSGVSGSGGSPGSGGGVAPTGPPPGRIQPPPGKHSHGRWLARFGLTEYWPAPESWFVGKLVRAPGLPGRHRIDWLYSAMGVCMEGQGIGLDGRMYHLEAGGDAGWVTAAGTPTSPSAGWSGGPPYWRAGGYWRNRRGAVTFPLAAGGWSRGRGRRYVKLPGIRFAAGPALRLRFYRSIAVDPSVIPLGSRVYIPAYRYDGYGGWFIAQDTGAAILGRRIDVYRSPPASSADGGQYLVDQPVYVIKPSR